MNGVRFYLGYPNSAEKRKATRKRLGNHSGNVIAVLDNDNYNKRFCQDFERKWRGMISIFERRRSIGLQVYMRNLCS